MQVYTSSDGGRVFSRLPESKPQRQRRLGGAVVSTVVHLVFIALAVRATGLEAETAPETTPVPPIFIAPPEPTPSPEPVVRRSNDTPASESPAPTVPPTPALPDFAEIVPNIPPPGQAIDLEAWDRRARVAAESPIAAAGTGGSPNGAGGSPMPEYLVEKPILAIPGTSTPRYPSMLQSAGVEGDVRAQFVVDTLGRVEPGSVKILEKSHDLFGTAVRDALMRARFAPAEAGGRKVRQLAEQIFTFRITR